jgi:zinc protease
MRSDENDKVFEQHQKFPFKDYKELPLVNISITLPGGHLMQSLDTAKIGLAGFTASMLNEDTKNYTAEQMSVALQKLGSSISVGNTFDGIRFSLQCQKKNLSKKK